MRLARSGRTHHGTFGRLSFADGLWHTVERKWVNNEPNISCVPAGAYTVHPLTQEFLLLIGGTVAAYSSDLRPPVVTRYSCGIHAANLAVDVKGCIGPGMRRGEIGGVDAVLESRTALAEIVERMDNRPAQLVIYWT